MAASGSTTGATVGGHAVQFHGHDEELVGAVAAYLRQALADGQGAVVVATPAHRLAVLRDLARAGVDVTAEQISGRLVVADARRTLARFMADGHPEPGALEAAVDGFVTRAGACATRPSSSSPSSPPMP